MYTLGTVWMTKVEYRLRSPLAFGQINFDSVANIQDFQWLKSAFITFLFNWYFKFSDGWFSDGVFGPTLNSTQGCLFHTEIDCDLPKDKDGKQCSFFPKFSTIRLCVIEIVGSDLSIKRNHSFDWINPFRFEISWALSTISFRETAPWLNKTVWSRVFFFPTRWLKNQQRDKPNFKIPLDVKQPVEEEQGRSQSILIANDTRP